MKTPTVRLVLLGQPGVRQVYGTRRLTAGDEFDERRDIAELLIRIGKARLAAAPAAPVARKAPAAAPKAPVVSRETQPPPETVEAPEPADSEDELRRLRDEANELGLTVDGRWGARRLQAEIDVERQRLRGG